MIHVAREASYRHDVQPETTGARTERLLDELKRIEQDESCAFLGRKDGPQPQGNRQEHERKTGNEQHRLRLVLLDDEITRPESHNQ